MTELHPDLPPGGWLGVRRGQLAALRLVPGGLELWTTPGKVETVIALDRVRRRGRRIRLDSPTTGRHTVRLVGPGDHRKKRLGEDVSSGLFDGGAGAGDDPISAILGLVELAGIVIMGPFVFAAAVGRWSRGRGEGDRLAAALTDGR